MPPLHAMAVGAAAAQALRWGLRPLLRRVRGRAGEQAARRGGPGGFIRDARELLREARALVLMLDDKGLLKQRRPKAAEQAGGAVGSSSGGSSLAEVRELVRDINQTLNNAAKLVHERPVERVTAMIAGEIKRAPKPPGHVGGFEKTRVLVEDARKAVDGCLQALEVRGVRACFPGERVLLLGEERASPSGGPDTAQTSPSNPITSSRASRGRRKGSKTSERALVTQRPALTRVGEICNDAKDAVTTAKQLLELEHVRERMGSGSGAAALAPRERAGSGTGAAAAALALVNSDAHGGGGGTSASASGMRRVGSGGNLANNGLWVESDRPRSDSHVQLRALENIARNTNVAMQALEKNVRTLSNPEVRREWRHFVYKVLIAIFACFAAISSWVWWLRSQDVDNDGRITMDELCNGMKGVSMGMFDCTLFPAVPAALRGGADVDMADMYAAQLGTQ